MKRLLLTHSSKFHHLPSGQEELPGSPGYPGPGGDRGPGGAARARAGGVRPLVRGRGELQPRHPRGPAPEHLPGEAAGHGGGAAQRPHPGPLAPALWEKTGGYSDKHCEIFV